MRATLLLCLCFFLIPFSTHAQSLGDADWSDQYSLLGADGPVYSAVEGPDGHLYVGGDFTAVSGVPAESIARWNTVQQRWEPLNLGLLGRVEDLTFLSDGTLVAVGNFSFRNTIYEAYAGAAVAIWNGSTWSSPGGGTTARIPGGYAGSVAADGTAFYVSGNFTQVTQPNGTTLNTQAIARWNGSQWEALGDGSSTATNGVARNTGGSFVRDLLLDTDGTLLVAGTFEHARLSDGSTLPLRGLARWHPGTQTWSGFGDEIQDLHNGAKDVYQVVRSGDDYYVRFNNASGELYQSDGTLLYAKFVAKWNGSSEAWEVLGQPNTQSWMSLSGVNQASGLFIDSGGNLVVIGAATAYNGGTQTATNGFARWTGSGWTPHLPAPAGIATYGTYNEASATALPVGSDLYVFAPFLALQDGAGTTDVWRTARFDGTNWHALGSGGHLGLTIATGIANSLAVVTHGNHVYVAGRVVQAGSETVQGFARLDRTTRTWEPLGTLVYNGNSPEVSAMKVWGDRILIGGRFDRGTNPGGATVHSENVIAWNTQTEQWESFGDGTQTQNSNRNGVEGIVTDLDVLPNGDLVIVGSFSKANQADGTQLDVMNVVLWDTAQARWKLLAPGQPGQPVGINKNVLAVAVDAAGNLYIGGMGSEARQPDGSEINTNRIVKWDGTQWRNLGVGVTQSSGSEIYDIAVVGSEVFVGGSFTWIDNPASSVTTRGLARWDGSQWHAYGSLPNNATSVSRMFAHGGSLFIGGSLGTGLEGIAYCAPACTTLGSGLGGYDGTNPVSPLAMDVAGSSLFAVGGFQAAGGRPSLRIGEFTNVPTPARLAAPLFLTPYDGALAVALSSTFTWSTIYSATAYDLQVATDAAFTHLVSDQSGLASASATVGSLGVATRYYARVRARNGGIASDWSVPITFITTANQVPSAPVLATPADGATNQAPATPLQWEAATQAFTYTIQIATDAGFGAIVHEQQDVADLSYTVSPSLALNTTHYWRVRASNNMGDGPWSAVWSYGTAEADLATPFLIYPSNGGENLNTSFSAQFTGISGATSYLLQFAEDPAFTVNVKEVTSSGGTGTRYVSVSSAGLTSGTRYYWRVQGLNNMGHKGPWSTVFTFKTSGTHPNAPPVPVLKAPANNATNIPIIPTLEWYASTGASAYDVQISTSTSFSQQYLLLDTSGHSGTSLTPEGLTLNTNTIYYWRVRAKNQYESNWSGYWYFRTTSVVIGRPTLTSPEDEATEQPVRPTLTWEAVSGASFYSVQVSDTPDFSNLVATGSPSATSYTLSAVLDGNAARYYWRVQARQGSAYGPWSTAWSFTTNTMPPPAAPALLSPASGGIIRYKYNTFAPYVTWLPSDGATDYQVQFSTDATFDENDFMSGTGGSQAHVPAWLDDLVFYQRSNLTHVRVRAVGAGGPGPWSTPHAFTIQNVGDAMPYHNWNGIPGHGTRGLGTSGTFTWFTAGHAQTDIEVATDPAFTNVVFSAANTNGSVAYSGLTQGTGYFYRLRPSGGAWSSTFWFETTDGIPDLAPTLNVPTEGAVNVDRLPTFIWTTLLDAESYQIQVSSNNTFAAPLMDAQVNGDTFTATTALDYLTPYYWRVRAVGAVGPGPWSTAATFTTRTPPPPAPTLLDPASGATDVPINTPLAWSKPVGAQSFSYEVATDADFQNIGRSGNSNTNSAVLGGLATGTTFYVRLRAVYDEGVTSEWSAAFSFSTLSYPAPATPVLTGPVDGATDVSVPFTLRWDAVAGASRYQIQINTSNSFDGDRLLIDSIREAVKYVYYTANPNETYYWRVRAIAGPSGSDAASAWSEVRVLSTGSAQAPDTAPTPTAPAHNATNVSRSVTFAWEPVAGPVAYYEVAYAIDPAFPNPGTMTLWAYEGATTVSPGFAMGGQVWYWRVRAQSTSGPGPWSDVSTFILAAAYPPEGSPMLIRPTYNAVVAQEPVFEWNSVPNATIYDVEVDDDHLFGSPVFSTSVSERRLTVTGLAPGTVYYARLRARNDQGAGGWGQIQFATRNAPSAETVVLQGDPPPVTLTNAGGIEVDFSTLGSDATLSAVLHTTEPPGGFAVVNTQLTTTKYWTLSLDGTEAFETDVCFPLSEVAGPVTDYSQLTVYKRSAEGEAWQALSTELRPVENPTHLCATGISSFSDFVVGAPPEALPVELVLFEAVADGDRIHLQWRTASETNNAGFEVQRQAEDGPWTVAGWLDGQGTTTEAQDYSFTDIGLPYDARTIRYRLRQVDFDGKFTYSEVLETQPGLPETFALEPNFPNPFRDATTIRYALPTDARVSLVVYDVLGRVVRVLVDEAQLAGRYQIRFEAQDLASGLYLYQLRAGAHVQSHRLLIVK